MTTRAEIELTNEVGLHARPAAVFVKRAKGYASQVRVHRDDRSADARSLLEVLKLEAGRGAVVAVEADGEDEEQAVAELVALLEELE